MPGNTNPPVPVPHATIPIATARLLSKYVATTAIVGQNKNPFPNPIHTPCARNNCQYDPPAKLDEKIPSTCSAEPKASTGRKYPASVRRPVSAPTKKRRKTWKEPIHEMSAGGREREEA